MTTVHKMHELKTHLSRLVKEVDKGTVLVFGSGGKPQYMITKYTPPAKKRGGYGIYKVTYSVEADLGGWTTDELKDFEQHDPLISA